MGQFVFLPAKGQTYTVRIKTADGRSLSFPFPPVQEKGVVMQAINFPSGDIRVVMSQPETQLTAERTFILIAQMRGAHFYAASVKPSKKDVVFQIPAKVVPGQSQGNFLQRRPGKWLPNNIRRTGYWLCRKPYHSIFS
jgi:hypothetical protein